jgi:hypothetical protein
MGMGMGTARTSIITIMRLTRPIGRMRGQPDSCIAAPA